MLLKHYIEQNEGGGIDPKYYSKLAMVESSGDPKAKAKTSSASGLYQFVDETWTGMVNKLNLPYTMDDRFDPEKSRKVVEAFTNENRSNLIKSLGREPNEGELYLAHVLGAGGASNLLKDIQENPNREVTSVVGNRAIQANRSIFLNKDGTPKTVGEIYNWSSQKMGRAPEFKVQTNATDKRDNTESNTNPHIGFDEYMANYQSQGEVPVIRQEGESKIDFFNFGTIKELEEQRAVKEQQLLQGFAQQQQQEMQQRQAEQQDYAQQSQEVYPEMGDPYNYIDVENYQDGGYKKRVYVENEKNPKYVAYKDSITLHENFRDYDKRNIIDNSDEFVDAYLRTSTLNKTSPTIPNNEESFKYPEQEVIIRPFNKYTPQVQSTNSLAPQAPISPQPSFSEELQKIEPKYWSIDKRTRNASGNYDSERYKSYDPKHIEYLENKEKADKLSNTRGIHNKTIITPKYGKK